MFKKLSNVRTFLIGFLLFSIFSFPVYAQELTTSSGNLYVAQENYTLSNEVSGDAIIAGGDISVNVNVENNLIVAGGNVVVNGDIGGDVLIAAGGLILNGNIRGDVRIIAGMVFINSENIGGDLVALSGNASVSSETEINGETMVRAGSYMSNAINNPTTIDELRNMTGVYYGLRSENLRDVFELGAALSVISLILTILYFFGGYLAQLFVLKVFPVISFSSMEVMRRNWLKSFLVGLLVLLASPFIALILLISGIGGPLLVLLLALFLVVWFFAMAYPSFLLGNYLLKLANRSESAIWIKLAIGYILLYLIFVIVGAIPIVGFGISRLLSLVITSWSIGGMLLNKWNKMQVRVEELGSGGNRKRK